MTAPDLALAETDPAGFVLAVADLRESRTKDAAPGIWRAEKVYDETYAIWPVPVMDADGPEGHPEESARATRENAEHIAAEANPAHALAEVRQWRSVVERHGRGLGKFGWCDTCGKVNGSVPYPCPDLLAVVAAAKAYLGGAA